jgi:hypothetical protein
MPRPTTSSRRSLRRFSLDVLQANAEAIRSTHVGGSPRCLPGGSDHVR